MRKKTISLLVMLFVMLFAIDVKADWSPYSLEKEVSYGGSYFDWMPTEVKKGDIVTVKVKTNMARDNSTIEGGYYSIRWDSKAFELVENHGKYYTLKNENVEVYRDYFYGDNNYNIMFYGNEELYDYDYYEGTPLFEFKFRVLDDVQDGVYNIYQTEGDGELEVNWEPEYESDEGTALLRGYEIKLRYQVGKEKVVSGYTADSLASNSYVIGSHLFTREGSDEYPGILTTPYIMLASKTIKSDSTDDMIIYVKSATGAWKNAITGAEITPPEKFDITYVDMKANYTNNGLYAVNEDSDDYEIWALTQINDKQVIVTFEKNNERVHGTGTLNGKVVTLSVEGKNYTITFGDDEITIVTNDSNVTTKRLPKKVNYDKNDYYENEYGNRYYLKAEATGKYVLGNNEIYLVQLGSENYGYCIKSASSSKCTYNGGVYGDYIEIAEEWYEITLEDGNLTLVPEEEGEYGGTYAKESGLTMDDIFALEENDVQYRVFLKLDEDDDYNYDSYWVGHGEKLPKGEIDAYEPTKDGHAFVGWTLNGELFDFNKSITSPITLIAEWEINIPTPVISLGLTYNYYQRGIVINNSNEYCSFDECNIENSTSINFSGYEVYEKINGEYNLVAGRGDKASYEFTMEPNTTKVFAIRVYVADDDDNMVYSEYSNEVESDTTIPTPVAVFTDKANGDVDYSSYSEGTYTYKVTVDNLRDFGYEFENEWYVANHVVNGFDLFEMVDNHLQPPVSFDSNNPATITVTGTEAKHYYVKAYVYVDGNKVYSELSNELIVNDVFDVLFNSRGGTQIDGQFVVKGGKVIKPADPEKTGYTFVEWLLNGEAYDFNTAVTGNITLTAKWTSDEPVVFSGIYYRNDKPIKLYSVSNDIVVVKSIDNNTINKAFNANGGVIEFEENGVSYYITKKGSNIELITDSTQYASGEYERIQDYTTDEYFSNSYGTNNTYLSDSKYNMKATFQDGEYSITMHMYKFDDELVFVYLKDSDGIESAGEGLIGEDGNLYYCHWDPTHEEYVADSIKISINDENTEYTYYSYDSGNPDAFGNGTYTRVGNVTKEVIISELYWWIPFYMH